MVWYSHLFQNFPQFIVIHTVKGFGIVNKAEIDVFLKLCCFFGNPADVGNLICGSSGFSKSILNIWKFSVHVLLKPNLELVVKNLPANARDLREVGSVSGSGRSPGGGHGNPLQYSCLENPMDRGACRLQSIWWQRIRHN